MSRRRAPGSFRQFATPRAGLASTFDAPRARFVSQFLHAGFVWKTTLAARSILSMSPMFTKRGEIQRLSGQFASRSTATRAGFASQFRRAVPGATGRTRPKLRRPHGARVAYDPRHPSGRPVSPAPGSFRRFATPRAGLVSQFRRTGLRSDSVHRVFKEPARERLPKRVSRPGTAAIRRNFSTAQPSTPGRRGGGSSLGLASSPCVRS